jgi:hypothetical protein
MLSYEWRELEALCNRISDLRQRLASAHRTKNTGLIQGLQDDLALARRQRELLVHHISARLGSAAANNTITPATAGHLPAAGPVARAAGLDPRETDESAIVFGFEADGASAP